MHPSSCDSAPEDFSWSLVCDSVGCLSEQLQSGLVLEPSDQRLEFSSILLCSHSCLLVTSTRRSVKCPLGCEKFYLCCFGSTLLEPLFCFCCDFGCLIRF
jgi:hypothetical protein